MGRGRRVGAQACVLLSDVGDQFGIHPVRFGAVTHGLGVVSGIQRIEQKYGIALCVRQVGQSFVIAAGRLQADAAAGG